MFSSLELDLGVLPLFTGMSLSFDLHCDEDGFHGDWSIDWGSLGWIVGSLRESGDLVGFGYLIIILVCRSLPCSPPPPPALSKLAEWLIYVRSDQADSQAPGSTPMHHFTNYSIKTSGKISHFTNVIPTEMNYVDTLIISIPKSNSPNMRNITRMSNLLGLMRSQISGL